MARNLLVRGGMVVDGTGGPARKADVRVTDGVIAEIGPTLAPDGEAELDASGAFVAPGFIDSHTHYDPSLWWDPLLDPMPQHGVTTVVTGNCSLSLTPVRARDRTGASDVFGFIEDIPLDAFATGIPWTWESYAEWRDALAAHGTAVNIAALVGHSNLRTYVMGDEAWERAATADERATIANVLRECLDAGALGLSTSFLDQNRSARIVEQAHKLHADGCRVYGQVSPRPTGHNVSFDQTPVFIAIPAWTRLIQQTPDEKRRLLRDDNWRAQARADWDKVGNGFTIFPVNQLERVRLVSA